MTPYILFSDIDGTLIRSGTPPLPNVLAAAERFRSAGGILALCTGRSPLSTRGLAREFGIAAPCVLFSGAAVFDFAADAAVQTAALPPDTADLAARLVAAHPECSLQAYTPERAYLLQSNAVLQARGIREELEGGTTKASDIRGDILKLVLTHPDPEALRAIGAQCFDSRHHFAFASRRFAEVVAKGADKGSGVRAVARMLGVPADRTLGAGDAMTDMAMFEACAFSYAPEDAQPEVLARCDMTIPSSDKGGMEAAFDHAIRLMAGEKP